jgi:hypothetical protein
MISPMDSQETPALDPVVWRRCNSCKKPINYGKLYWVCNVSTCNRKRTGLIFCEVSCWDAHVPMMNHKESWAEERKAPTRDEWARTLSGEDRVPRTRKPKEEAKAEEPKAPAGPPKVLLRRKPE